MTKSAKSVRVSDGTNYQNASQGNISNPRAYVKGYNAQQSKRAVGGTDNAIRAMFGLDGKKLCVTVDPTAGMRNGKAYVPATTSFGYDNSNSPKISGPKRSDNTVTSVPSMNLDTLLKRAAQKDMSLVEYCAFIGYPLSEYTPGIADVEIN